MIQFPTNTNYAAFSAPVCRAVVFQREKGGPSEWGFYINEEILLDASGKIPDEVWDIDTKLQCCLPAMYLPVKYIITPRKK